MTQRKQNSRRIDEIVAQSDDKGILYILSTDACSLWHLQNPVDTS